MAASATFNKIAKWALFLNNIQSMTRQNQFWFLKGKLTNKKYMRYPKKFLKRMIRISGCERHFSTKLTQKNVCLSTGNNIHR